MMTFKLPYQNFRLIKGQKLKSLENKLIRKQYIDVDGDKTFFVKCDLDYPSNLHKIHEQWPLAPDKCEVTYEA